MEPDASGSRTGDPLITNEMLYQLSYAGIVNLLKIMEKFSFSGDRKIEHILKIVSSIIGEYSVDTYLISLPALEFFSFPSSSI